MLVNTRSKQTDWWKKGAIAILVAAVSVSLFSIFYAPEKPSEDIRSNVTPVSQETQSESVLSESVDTTVDNANAAYEEALSVAQAACEQAGFSPESAAYDDCTEREVSQRGH